MERGCQEIPHQLPHQPRLQIVVQGAENERRLVAQKLAHRKQGSGWKDESE